MSSEKTNDWPNNGEESGRAFKTISDILEGFCSEDREACRYTPMRWIHSMRELLSGYSADPKLTTFPAENDNMVLKRHIKYYSLCKHHLLPFYGHAYIAYIPDKWILGLSKISRIVEKFSRRLQIQEGLTEEIALALIEVLETSNVMVILTGEHLCERMRGAENDEAESLMITSHISGVFKKHETRMEALELMNVGR